MNNKGFTLIEILVVVAILGMLGVVVTISLGSTLENVKQKECDAFIEEIESGACVYASLSNKLIECNIENCSPIPLEILVQEGMIKSEKDACTGGNINLKETVSVIWNKRGEKYCTYNGVRVYEK